MSTKAMRAVLEAANAVLVKAQLALESLNTEKKLLEVDPYASGAQARAIAHAEALGREVAKLRNALDRLAP